MSSGKGLRNILGIGGITNPEAASAFSKQNEVTLTLSGVARGTTRDLYNALVPGVVGGIAGATGRAAGGALRTFVNWTAGPVWVAGQRGAKIIETIGEAPQNLRWNEGSNGKHQ